MKSFRMTLQNKLYMAFLVTVLLPLILITFFACQRSSFLIEDQSVTWQINALNQAEESLAFRMEAILNLFDSVLTNTTLWRLINEGANPGNLPQQLSDIKDIEKLVSGIESNSQIVKMRLYLDNTGYATENTTIRSLTSFMEIDMFQRIQNSGERIFFSEGYPYNNFYGNEEQVVSSFVSVRSFQDLSVHAMVVELIIREAYFTDMLDSLAEEIGASAFLVDYNGNIMLRSGNSTETGAAIVGEQMGSTLEDWRKISYKGASYYLGQRKISRTDWALYFILPELEVIKQSNQLRNELLLTALLCLFFLSCIILPLSRIITRRLGQLRGAMRTVQKGNLHVDLQIVGNDEISDLGEDFNFMLREINVLIREQSITLDKLRTQELNALNSQINPHFLYNSLDLINWMAFEREAAEIQEAVSDLARFYKVSLSKGETLIPLRDELTHVTMYTNIQNLRYDNAVSFCCDVPEELLDYLIPKITLQPIVENSFVHGILQKPAKSGTISVSVREVNLGEKKLLHIEVEDDGAGFSEGNPPTLGKSEAYGRGYGLSNVDDRLRLYYGEGCGLSFPERRSGEGAVVLVTTLLVKDKDELNQWRIGES